MEIVATPLTGVVEVTTTPRVDPRGRFARWFCADELAPLGGGERIVQVNHSVTHARGSVRGLHFQHPPHAEVKFVRCIKGRVFDVAVDLRATSPTFLRWHAVELGAARGNLIAIPKGCAHGFQTLEDDCELLYLHTAAYAPDAEDGIACDDPRLAIAWPLPIDRTLLSDRDRALRPLAGDYAGLWL